MKDRGESSRQLGSVREGLLRSYLDLGGVRGDAILFSLLREDLGNPVPR